jgi:zinc protease
MKLQPRFWVFLISAAATLLKAGSPSLTSKILANGLEVIVVENHTVPLATIGLVFKNGSFTETQAENGLTHLHTHMLFKANQAYPAHEAYLERIRELGAVTSGHCREEWVIFKATLPTDSLASGLEFAAHSVQYPIFTGDRLALEKQAVRDELVREAANPSYHLVVARRSKLWGQNLSRKDYLGSPRVIASATLEQIRLIHERYVIPNNTALLVAGDVDPGKVIRLVKDFFGDWESGTDPASINPIPPIIPLESSGDTVVVQPVNTAEIVIAWHGPSVGVDVKGTFAADVFSLILGQKTSEFQKNLVESGLALSTNQIYFTQKYVGPISISVKCRPQKFWETYQALEAEIEKFDDTDYFTDDQLATAKTLLEVNAVYKGDKASSHIEEIGFWWAVAGLEYYRDYLDNLRSVTRDDVLDYVRRHIIGQSHITAVMVNRETRRNMKVVDGRLVP